VQPASGSFASSLAGLFALRRSDVHTIMFGTCESVKSNFLIAFSEGLPALSANETFSRHLGSIFLVKFRCKQSGCQELVITHTSQLFREPIWAVLVI
jgi:hypothetical protein